MKKRPNKLECLFSGNSVQPSLTFGNKAVVYPGGTPFMLDQAGKALPRTNTLAYFISSLLMTNKIILTNILNLLFSVVEKETK